MLRMTVGESIDLDRYADGNRSEFVRRAVAEKIEREWKKTKQKAAKRAQKEGKPHAESD